MRTVTRLALIVLVAFQLGCFRTHYVRLTPAAIEAAAESTEIPDRTRGWRSFFVWGWFPTEERIDASARCGGPDYLHSIHTRRTFLEGLVAGVAGFFVNIYSPWHGAMYCLAAPEAARTEPEEAAQPPPLVRAIELPPDPPPFKSDSEAECLAWQAYMESELDTQAEEIRAELIAERAAQPDDPVVDDAWRSFEADTAARLRFIETNARACQAAVRGE